MTNEERALLVGTLKRAKRCIQDLCKPKVPVRDVPHTLAEIDTRLNQLRRHGDCDRCGDPIPLAPD